MKHPKKRRKKKIDFMYICAKGCNQVSPHIHKQASLTELFKTTITGRAFDADILWKQTGSTGMAAWGAWISCWAMEIMENGTVVYRRCAQMHTPTTDKYTNHWCAHTKHVHKIHGWLVCANVWRLMFASREVRETYSAFYILPHEKAQHLPFWVLDVNVGTNILNGYLLQSSHSGF